MVAADSVRRCLIPLLDLSFTYKTDLIVIIIGGCLVPAQSFRAYDGAPNCAGLAASKTPGMARLCPVFLMPLHCSSNI